MSWTFKQSTGELTHNGEPGNGNQKVFAYSGYQAGKNNPELQAVPNVGPVPQGTWYIGGPPVPTAEHGPYVLHLTPAQGTETFGRSAFLIHGDSAAHPGEASRGCVIVPRNIRESIWLSGDHTLEVVA